MPKVVIELQANTQDAVNKIQQFARAQKDAFDAVKAGNPALQDAYVKVSKLTEGTGNAAKVTGEFNRAAKGLAVGGIQELTRGIPILDNVLIGLATTLRGFPGLLLGVAAAGYAFITYLKNVEAQADKTTKSLIGVSLGIQAGTMALAARVGGIRAGARGDLAGAAAADFRATEIEATATRDRALEAAQAARAGAISDIDRLQGKLNPQALRDKETIAEATYQTARAKAETDANEKITLAREQLKANLIKIEEDLDKKSEESADKRIKDAEAAAEKQKKLVADILGTVKGLGGDFGDVAKDLELQKFVTDTQAAIDTLNKGIEAGIDTHGRFGDAVQVLQQKMDEAIRLGYVPSIEKAAELGSAIEQAADSAESAGERWLKSMEGISQSLDEIIAKSRSMGPGGGAAGGVAGTAGSAVRPEAGGAMAGVLPGTASLGGGTGTVLGGILNQASGSGLTPLTGGASQLFDLGGISHPSIRDTGVLNPNPAFNAGYRPQPTTQTVNLTVNQTGTVVSNDRDWATVTAGISQALR